MNNYITIALKNYKSSYAGLPAKCWENIFLTFINALTIGVCFFLSLYFVNNLHFSIATASFFMSAYGLGTILGGILGGKLSDMVPAKQVSIISLLLQAMAFYALSALNSEAWLIFNMFLLGVASYGFKASNNVRMLNLCGTNTDLRLRTIGITHVALNLGLGISGIIIGYVADYGFNHIFNISTVLLLFSTFLLISKKDAKKEPDINTDATTSNKIETSDSQTNKKDNKIFALVLGCLFAIGLIISQLSSTYPIFIQTSYPELGVKAVSILFILDTVLIVLFQAPISKKISKYNKTLIVGLGALMMGLGMLTLTVAYFFGLALISCAIWTTGEMLFMSTAQLLCYEKAKIKRKGVSIGLFQTTYAASCVIGPALGGLIYQHYSGNVLWYISGILGALCFSLCVYFSKYD